MGLVWPQNYSLTVNLKSALKAVENYRSQMWRRWSAPAEKRWVLSGFMAKCRTRSEWPEKKLDWVRVMRPLPLSFLISLFIQMQIDQHFPFLSDWNIWSQSKNYIFKTGVFKNKQLKQNLASNNDFFLLWLHGGAVVLPHSELALIQVLVGFFSVWSVHVLPVHV